MNTPSHTPGPWFTATSGTGHYDSIWNADGEIAQCVTTSYVANEANAKLIAAAPELLEALKAMLATFGEDGPFGQTEAEKEARAAIAKATNA